MTVKGNPARYNQDEKVCDKMVTFIH